MYKRKGTDYFIKQKSSLPFTAIQIISHKYLPTTKDKGFTIPQVITEKCLHYQFNIRMIKHCWEEDPCVV